MLYPVGSIGSWWLTRGQVARPASGARGLLRASFLAPGVGVGGWDSLRGLLREDRATGCPQVVEYLDTLTRHAARTQTIAGFAHPDLSGCGDRRRGYPPDLRRAQGVRQRGSSAPSRCTRQNIDRIELFRAVTSVGRSSTTSGRCAGRPRRSRRSGRRPPRPDHGCRGLVAPGAPWRYPSSPTTGGRQPRPVRSGRPTAAPRSPGHPVPPYDGRGPGGPPPRATAARQPLDDRPSRSRSRRSVDPPSSRGSHRTTRGQRRATARPSSARRRPSARPRVSRHHRRAVDGRSPAGASGRRSGASCRSWSVAAPGPDLPHPDVPGQGLRHPLGWNRVRACTAARAA